MPVSASNWATVPSLPGSMYSGHCEIVSVSLDLSAGTVPAGPSEPESIAESLPQAARASAPASGTRHSRMRILRIRFQE
jgi:hypothetical protein